MGALELREKLIEKFNNYIKDESKLFVLDGIFDSLNTEDSPSLVSKDHYKIIEERRRRWKAGETKAQTWEDVKSELKKKYGF